MDNLFGTKDEETTLVVVAAAVVLHAMMSNRDTVSAVQTEKLVDRSFEVGRIFLDRAKLEHARAQS